MDNAIAAQGDILDLLWVKPRALSHQIEPFDRDYFTRWWSATGHGWNTPLTSESGPRGSVAGRFTCLRSKPTSAAIDGHERNGRP